MEAEEIKKLLAACAQSNLARTISRQSRSYPRPITLRDTALITVLLDTGMRISELARLKVSDR
jgi:integrase